MAASTLHQPFNDVTVSVFVSILSISRGEVIGDVVMSNRISLPLVSITEEVRSNASEEFVE